MLDAYDSPCRTLARENPNETFIHGEARDGSGLTRPSSGQPSDPVAFENGVKRLSIWAGRRECTRVGEARPAAISLAWLGDGVVMRSARTRLV